MDQAKDNSLGGREVVRCSGCLLNQFMTRSKVCRRPGCAVVLESVPQFESGDVISVEGLPGLLTLGHTATSKPHRTRAGDLRSSGGKVRLDLAVLVIRNSLGLSQRQFAAKLNCPRTYISKVEGRLCDMTLKSINRFAHALEVTPRQLIEFATV